MKTSVKRIVAALMFALLAFALTGCVSMTVTLAINADGSADYGMEMLMADTLLEMAGQAGEGGDFLGETASKMTEDGYTVTRIENKDGYSGVNAFRHFEHVADIAEENGIGNAASLFGGDTDADFDIAEDKGFFATTYTVNASVDLTKSMPSGDAAELAGAMLDQMKFRMVVKLPLKAAEHNATSVSEDGLTYTWDLKLGSVNDISLKAAVPNMTNILLVGGGALLLLLAGAAVVIIVVAAGAKKKKAAQATATAEPPAGA